MFCGGAVWIFHCRAKMPVRHLRLDGEEQDPLQFQLHFEPKPQPHFPMVSIEIFDDEDFINVLSCCLGLSLKRVAQFLPPNYRPSLQPSNTSTSPQKLNGVSGNFSLRAWICISVLSICIGDKRNRTKKKEGWTGKEKKKNTWQWNRHIRYYKDHFKKKNSCLSTHFWGFFPWERECRKTMEGRYFSCLDVKEPKKIIPVPRFRQITPKNKARKSKKIGKRPFFMFKYPCLGIFSVGVRVP